MRTKVTILTPTPKGAFYPKTFKSPLGVLGVLGVLRVYKDLQKYSFCLYTYMN